MIENVGKTRVLAGQAAGTGSLTTASVDCSGVESVQFVVEMAADAAGSVTPIVQDSDDDSSFTTRSSTAVPVTPTADGRIVLDLVRPLKRYNRLFISRSVSCSIGGVTATTFQKRDRPATDGTGIDSRSRFVSPAS